MLLVMLAFRAAPCWSMHHSRGRLFQKGCNSCELRSLTSRALLARAFCDASLTPGHPTHDAGEWKEDLQDGLGTCQWVDGAEYRGSWKAGARHGRGVLSRPDGYTYDGEWAEDIFHGSGLCLSEDGSRHGSLGSRTFRSEQEGCVKPECLELMLAQTTS